MVAAAMTRSIRSDSARTDAQRLTGREALLSLTANAAWQGHAEDWRGRIAPGYAADLVVLDSAVDWSDPWSLTERGIRATMISGQVCHGSL
jgi:predicted amidohydrolase YtcJ